MKRVLASWSSGKDCAWALHLLQQQAEWYSSIGRCDLQPSTVLNSWEEAIAFATSGRDGEFFRLEQRNELTVFLHKNAMDRFRK